MKILVIFFVLFLISTNTIFAATDSEVSTKIGSVQATTTGLPPAPTNMDQKGFVGEIIANIFDTSAGVKAIKNVFIVALRNLSTGLTNNVPKWNGNAFVAGIITDTGTNIGIGTTTPTQKLEVIGSSLVTGRVYIGDDTNSFRSGTNRILTDNEFYVTATSPNTYLYSTNTYLGGTSGATTRLRGNDFIWNSGIIQGNGNVGIGTSSPAYNLDVTGTVNATLLRGNGASITSINGANITNATISGSKILGNAIVSSHILDNSIVAADIATNAITNSELGLNSVSGANIITGTITSSDIASNAITSNELASNSVSSGHIINGSIVAADIATNSITSSELASNSVSGSHIINATITAADIASNTITASNIGANAITNSELANGAVNSASILNYSIIGDDIASNTLTAGKIAANSITGSELSDTSSFKMGTLDVSGYIYGKFNCRRVVSNETFSANAEANCSSTEFVMSGGGSCKVPSDDYLETSVPISGLTGWSVNCRTRLGNNAAQTAYAICCSK